MTLAITVAELLALANDGPPTAATIRAALAGRDLTAAVHTINLRDDPRGWGSYAELVVNAEARVRDLVPVLGELRPAPRHPGDPVSGAKLSTDLQRGDMTVRVFVELAPRSADRIAYVTIQFQTQPRVR